MPSLNQKFASDPELMRVMAYGNSMCRKTWWAGLLAEAGYNVLFCDSDGNSTTLRQLSAKAQARIYHLDVTDTNTTPVAASFWGALLQDHHLYYNETTKLVTQFPSNGSIHVDVRNFNRNFCIVQDSYTSLVQSTCLSYANANNITLSDAAKTEWEGYGWQGRFLDWTLEALGSLPCHVISVAHATNYEKKKMVANHLGRLSPVTEWTRRQPFSCSNPHGMRIARNFGEFYYFRQEGARATIEPFGNELADGGSRFLPRTALEWQKFPPGKCFAMAGQPNPPVDLTPISFEMSDAPALTAARRAPVLAPTPRAAILAPN